MGSVVVSIVPGGAHQAMAKVAALLPPLAAAKKPVAVAVMGDEAPLPENFVASFRQNGVPVFRSPERALRAMAHATAYGRQRASAARATNDVAVPAIELPRSGVLPEFAGKEILARLGIPTPRGELARDVGQAQDIARRIGYPIVVKAQAAELAHKSDVGGVIVGIADADALASAWERLHQNVAAAKPGQGLDGVLVETMAAPGVEMVVGGRRDPDWGPVVMVGLGGVWIETLQDVRLMPPALSRAAIADEVAKLKGFGLLRGARGKPPADIDALVDTIATIGALLTARPDVAEIDINPLVVYPKGVLALDVLLVVSP